MRFTYTGNHTHVSHCGHYRIDRGKYSLLWLANYREKVDAKFTELLDLTETYLQAKQVCDKYEERIKR